MGASGYRDKRCRSLIMGSLCRLSVRHRGSVFPAHADYDEHCIVLLCAALDRRHCTSWRNGKCRLLCLGRRARTTRRRRCIARGTAGQVRDVVERCALIELPASVAMSLRSGRRCYASTLISHSNRRTRVVGYLDAVANPYCGMAYNDIYCHLWHSQIGKLPKEALDAEHEHFSA